MTRLLTEAQCRRYREDGLLFPVRVLSPEQARHCATACDALEQQLGGKPRTIEVRQMHLHFPWAYQLALHPKVLDAVEDLLGPDLLVWATELFIKHPQDESVSIAWHRDRTYMGFAPHTTVTAWIALADSHPLNGCMRAVPGAQRHVVEVGHATGADRGKRNGAGLPDGVGEHEVVEVVLAAGEMSLHDCAILHGSGPNRSTGKRVGFVVRYITPEARPPHGRPPVVLARGRAGKDHVRLVGPPAAASAGEALAGLKESAALHFETVLQNLRHAPRP
jgi:ectoine hydroxylase-related dioxygenase (phytanoyl-CoA dioxygenase family)